MHFEFKKRKPEEVEIKKLFVGDVFRFYDKVYIRLKDNESLSIYDNIITQLNIPPETKVELLDYSFEIYAEE